MKKMGIMIVLIVAAIVFSLVFPAIAAGPKAPAAPVAKVPTAAAVFAAMPERHPHIDEALEAMRSAKHHLESAEHDFQGHRVSAIEHLNKAIHEAEICMAMK